jgi:pSer/pThr/pTyr-binding forkhead associated (FHA) protein
MSGTVTLTVVNGMLDGQEYAFAERTWCTVGRGDDCHVHFPSGLAFQDISRRHCLLDVDPPEIRVRDLGSRNGTFVNGRMIGQRSKDQTPEDAPGCNLEDVVLHDGDEIKVGQVILRVRISAAVEKHAGQESDPGILVH